MTVGPGATIRLFRRPPPTRGPRPPKGPPAPAPSDPRPPEPGARDARRSRLGLGLALFFAVFLAAARVVDVSENGKAVYGFGLAFAAVSLLCALLSPRWVPLLLVAYLPFSKAYPVLAGGVPGANMTNLLLLIGLLAWVSARMEPGRRVPLGAVELLLLAFMATGVLAYLNARAQTPEATLSEFIWVLKSWLSPMLFFFVVRGLVRDRENLRDVLTVLVFTAALVAAATWSEGIERAGRGSIEASRVKGLLGQANTMGAFLVYYAPPALALALLPGGWPRRALFFIVFLVAARATLYTFSRGAYLALAAGSTLVLFLRHPLYLVGATGGGLLALALFPGLMPYSVAARLGHTTTEIPLYEDGVTSLDRSSQHRLVLWRAALGMIRDHPVGGVGLGRFPLVVDSYAEVPLGPEDPRDAHNAYLLVAAEMGLPALALMLSLLGMLGAMALRMYLRRRDPSDRGLCLVFLGTEAAVLVGCMLGSRFSDEALIGYFWVLAALLVVLRGLRESPPKQGSRAWR